MGIEQVRQAFIKGQAHPKCPQCQTQAHLRMSGNISEGEIKDGSWWRRYKCVRCNTIFSAAVEDRKENAQSND